MKFKMGDLVLRRRGTLSGPRRFHWCVGLVYKRNECVFIRWRSDGVRIKAATLNGVASKEYALTRFNDYHRRIRNLILLELMMCGSKSLMEGGRKISEKLQ
jgi:hypothetical protein